jgi:hypothetical protein
MAPGYMARRLIRCAIQRKVRERFRYLNSGHAVFELYADIDHAMSYGVIAPRQKVKVHRRRLSFRVACRESLPRKIFSPSIKKACPSRKLFAGSLRQRAMPHDFPAKFFNDATEINGMPIAAGKKPLRWQIEWGMDRAKKQHAGNRYMSALCGRIVGDGQDRRAHWDDIRVGHTRVALPHMRIHGKGNTLSG